MTTGHSPHPPARRVALYGGSFDPPHIGHVLAATWVVTREPVDELRVIPVYRHAFGKHSTPFAVRCEMAQAAFAHLAPRVTVSRIEERLGGTSYTIDTVRALLAEAPPGALSLSFVCGTDVYAERERWKEWDTLRSLLRFLVLGRDGAPDPPPEVEIRAWLPDVSSTDIRRRVRDGAPWGHLVPEPVRALIQREGLYRP